MTRHYATVAKQEQIGVLLGSMLRHCGDFVLHVLAWDWDEPRRWEQFEGAGCKAKVQYTRGDVFRANHPELAAASLPGPPRKPVDTVATVRWQFFADVMEATGEPLTWLDGDIHFFSSPEPLYAELAAARARLAVSPHRIPPAARNLPGVKQETHGIYGRFNTGLGWASDPDPLREMAILNRGWSYTEVRPRAGRRPLFGDQGWLEDIAERHGAHVIAHGGVNAAPWNAFNRPILRGIFADHPFIGDDPLVCWHFSSLRLNPDGTVRQLADPCYEVERAPGAVELVYRPFLAALAAARAG